MYFKYTACWFSSLWNNFKTVLAQNCWFINFFKVFFCFAKKITIIIIINYKITILFMMLDRSKKICFVHPPNGDFLFFFVILFFWNKKYLVFKKCGYGMNNYLVLLMFTINPYNLTLLCLIFLLTFSFIFSFFFLMFV